MSDPDISMIEAAANAQNQLHGRVASFFDTLDAEIAVRQAAYDALAADLVAVFDQRLSFTAYVNPDEAAPTGGPGGTFLTIAEAIGASPDGASVTVLLERGKTHVVSDRINVGNRSLFFAQTGVGSGPIIAPTATNPGSQNQMQGQLYSNRDPYISFNGITIQLPAAPNGAQSWGFSKQGFLDCTTLRLFLDQCVVNGSDGSGLIELYNGARVAISTFFTTLDGDFSLIAKASQGVSQISRTVLTLNNGAALTDGGTVGVNILQN